MITMWNHDGEEVYRETECGLEGCTADPKGTVVVKPLAMRGALSVCLCQAHLEQLL